MHVSTTLAIGTAVALSGLMTNNLMAGPYDVWLNEFSYDDPGADDLEMIELAVGSAVDPCSVGIFLYNGANGALYNTLSVGLEFTAGATQNGMTMYWANLPTNTMQNGAPDGIAITIGANVVQFLSYEGSFTATDGPAISMVSSDIGVSQTSSLGTLGLSGLGSSYGDFSWQAFLAGSAGQINNGQVIFNVTHNVNASGVSFSPASINVHRGDTIVWSWINGYHTVTQGSGCSSGGMFNAALDPSHPTFSWIVPISAPATINYFCIPHCPWMVAVIHVLDDPVPCLSDIDGDGQVAVSDILTMISEWGGTNPMYDLDCDGIIGVGDLLTIISDWGPC